MVLGVSDDDNSAILHPHDYHVVDACFQDGILKLHLDWRTYSLAKFVVESHITDFYYVEATGISWCER